MTHEYEVALSFAGEDREFAESVAMGLKKAGVKVFYDIFFTPDLWGKDLSVKLRDIYHAQSRYCIMIITENYVKKMWTNFERQQAIERLIEQGGSDYILPVRLNDFTGEVPGLSKSIGFLSVSSKNHNRVVSAFLQKIGTTKSDELGIAEEVGQVQTVIPLIKKKFTDREKNQFLKDSYEKIISLLEKFLGTTCKKNPQIEYELDRITSRKTGFIVYDNGKELTRFKLWTSGSLGTDSIKFSYGSRIDLEGDDSFNESFSVHETDGELTLHPLGMLTLGSKRDKSMSPSEVAEYLWEAVCKSFQ
ncbi:TIR domain-containing protein [Candidatus Parvarchaeota archaeon]|nr:TIR domain-containing protein [Candidatus Parvarchaeota archaeon]